MSEQLELPGRLRPPTCGECGHWRGREGAFAGECWRPGRKVDSFCPTCDYECGMRLLGDIVQCPGCDTAFAAEPVDRVADIATACQHFTRSDRSHRAERAARVAPGRSTGQAEL